MARRSGLATGALIRHAKAHANFERYLTQGNRRAVQRSVKAAQDTKAREVIKRYRMTGTEFRGINAIKRKFRTQIGNRGALVDAVERLVARVGIPLRDFGAKQDKRGVRYMVRRGRRQLLRGGFLHRPSLGGRPHVFTRARKGGRRVKRLPIRKRFGPGLPLLIKNSEIAYRGRQRFQDRIREELEKEELRARKRARL